MSRHKLDVGRRTVISISKAIMADRYCDSQSRGERRAAGSHNGAAQCNTISRRQDEHSLLTRGSRSMYRTLVS